MKKLCLALWVMLLASPALADTIDFTNDTVTIDCTTAQYCQPMDGFFPLQKKFFITIKNPPDYDSIYSFWRSFAWWAKFKAEGEVAEFRANNRVIVNRDYVKTNLNHKTKTITIRLPKKYLIWEGMTQAQWERVVKDYNEWGN